MFQRFGRRSFSTAVKYNAHGVAKQVLKVESETVATKLGAKDVRVKFLGAPINHADINMIEGVYGIQAKMPAVAGNEGVAVVEAVGSDVKNVKVGDWVIPSKPAFGTWRKQAVSAEDDFLTIPNDIPMPYAATLSVNPCTAYRLLNDFAALKPGDVIMQNGANSMVGLAVIQMARARGIKTINIIRSDRPDVETTLRLLTGFGGDINVPENFVNSASFREIVADLPPIKLALNCVGGNSVADMARNLANDATIVTYGGMSKRAFSIPQEVVAYKQLNLKGFWISEWHKTHSREERTAMLNEVAKMIREKQLSFLFELHDFDDFDYALDTHFTPYYLRKVVLNIDHPDRMKEHDALPESAYEQFDAMYV